MDQPKPNNNSHNSFDPNQIYPTATAGLPSSQDERQQQNQHAKIMANAELEAKGHRYEYSQTKSTEVNIVAGLIITSGCISIILNHSPLSIAFNAIYILVGLGIYTRSELARKIVIYTSIVGLALNAISLLSTSAFLSGKKSIIPIISILFSIGVQITVLSILTWHANEREFH